MLCRCEPRHILHQSENRHVHLVVHIHVDALAGVGKRHLLGCGYNDRPADVDGLDECEVNVAGAWRRIYDKIVKGSPKRISQQLLDGVRSHTTTPERSLVGVDKETY